MSRREYDISLLPSDYTPLEYIESTGTQYIDTGVKIQSITDEIEIVAKYNGIDKAQCLFGVCERNPFTQEGQYVSNVYLQFNKTSNPRQYRLIAVNGDLFNDGDLSDFNLIHLKYDAVYLNRIKFINTISHTNFNNQLYLFARNNKINNTIDQFGSWAIKYFAIPNKRRAIPALRRSDNKPGLYDLCGSICPLTGTPFYVNAGAGEFLYA